MAVFPAAIIHGDVFGMSGTGWKFMLILAFTSGVAAQGLLVFAQNTIQIGTIAISQVAQPARREQRIARVVSRRLAYRVLPRS